MQIEVSISNLQVKVAQILIHECDKYKTIAHEQVNRKADVVVICLDAAGPLHDQLGDLLKSDPTLERVYSLKLVRNLFLKTF